MIQAEFYFHGSINELLSNDNEICCLRLDFSAHQTVMHLVESLHVPHTEVFLILVNGKLAEYDARLHSGDRVDVFPYNFNPFAEGNIDLQPETIHLFEIAQPGDEISFILDNHLGKLAVFLRMLGFDTWYRNDYQDPELADLAAQTMRYLLTRDRGLLMRKQVKKGYLIRSLNPKQQLKEVLLRFKLLDQVAPFKRCLRCNALMEKVAKTEVADRLLPLTRKYYDEFYLCRNCGQIYWKGSHFDPIEAFIDQLRWEQKTG